MALNTQTFSQITAAIAAAGGTIVGTLASGIDALYTIGGNLGIAFTDNAGNIDQSLIQTLGLPAGVTGFTQAANDFSTKLATTAHVKSAVSGNPFRSVPATGGTVSLNPPTTMITVQEINPAGTLATLTLTLGNGQFAGQIVYACFSQAITALTVTPGNFDFTHGLAAPTAAALGQSFGFIWDATNGKWNRFQ